MNLIRCKLTKSGAEEISTKINKLEKTLYELEINMDDIALAENVSENIEYQQMREKRLALKDEIERLKNVLDHADVMEERIYSKAMPGCQVNLANHKICYLLKLVSTYEANPMAGKISCSSPLGNSLVGKRVGEEIVVQTPLGKVNFEVMAVS